MKNIIYNNIKKKIVNAILIVSFGLFSVGLSAQTGNHVEGNGAGMSLTSGDYDTFVGDSAGRSNTSASYNTYLGYRAGYLFTTGSDNTFVGAEAGYGDAVYGYSTGVDNTFVGKMAGKNNRATDGTFVGTHAGYSNTVGRDNTFIGEEAGRSNIDGDDNTFVGEDAGYNNTTANDNTFIGSTAGRSNTTGYRNCFVGNEAGYDNTTGHWNTAVGDSSGTDMGAGWGNTMIGQAAGAATEHADFNTFIGARAGWDNNRNNATNNANRNTYVGFQAGYSNRAGEDNVGMGWDADFGSTIRYRNTFLGSSAYINSHDITSIGFNTYSTGQYSCMVGSGTDVRSEGAIAIGYLSNVQGGSNNSIAIGRSSDINDDHNIAIGYAAKVGTTIGLSNFNVAIGHQATIDSTFNIGIGNNVTMSGSNSIAIGGDVTSSNSNEVVIGNNATSVIGGSVNWTATSDGRFKSNVDENVVGLDFINSLRPVTYQMDHEKIYAFYGKVIPEYLKPALENKNQIRYSGFIAQEVEEQAIAAGYEFSGVKAPQNEEDAYGLRYAEFVVPLVKSTQELYDIIESQQQTISEYQVVLTELTKRVENMENQMDFKANKIFASKK